MITLILIFIIIYITTIIYYTYKYLRIYINYIHIILIINNNIIDEEIKNDYGRYIRQVVNGLREKEKEYFIIMMVKDMKVIGKTIKEKEKVFITLMMVIDMKVIL